MLKRFVVCAVLVSAGSAFGSTWNEAVNGDLSNDTAAPTALSFDLGVNRVIGTMGDDGSGIDPDVFTFTVGFDQQLTSINLSAFSSTGPVGGGSFIAIASGLEISESDPNQHLSNALIEPLGELLDDLATPEYGAGPGLTSPVGPGTYTFWIQETIAQVNYQLDFTYVVIPEPTTLGLLGAGALMLRRRK